MSARTTLVAALRQWADHYGPNLAPGVPEAMADAYRAEVLAEGGPRIWHVFEEDSAVTVPPLFASEAAAQDETIARYQEMEGSCPDYSWWPHEDGSHELLAGGEPVGIYLVQVPVTGAKEDQQKLIDQLRADRNAYADRVDTLTAVAKGNKRHVQMLFGDLQAAQARVAELERLLSEPREAAQPADAVGRCGRCRRPFDPADTRWDGHAEYHDSGYCRSCVDLCHNTEIADHRCPICAGPGDRS